MATNEYETRNSIEDIWGARTPYKHQWPVRVDQRTVDEPEKWVQSACVLCSNGCGLDIGVKDGKIVGVRGRAVDRVNHGRLGPKGLHGWVSNAHKDRLKYPLIRRNGKLERASWDEAMSLIVEKATSIRERLTAHGIAFYTTGQLFLEEYYALAVVGKAGLNTLHMDGNTRLCTATAAASMRESFGSDGQPGSYTDIDHTDCLFIVGHNVANTQTVLWSRMLDRLEGPNPPKLIVIDPRLSDTAKKATVHLAPKIGTNMAVLNGIQHLFFENGWVDEEWVKKHTVGLGELQEKTKMYTPKYVEEITGIPKAKLAEAAQILGTTKTLLSTVLQGVYQSNQATASACQINNINLLRGLIGKPGSGIYQMNGQPTAQNNREAGCDGEFPAFRNQLNPNHMQDIADVWNIDYIKIPHWNLPTHIQNMLRYIEDGSIEMFWINGTNPLVSLPNLPRVRELLTQPELFVICQDIFLTETAQIADVVLPAAQWAEKTGCFTNVDRTVHISHKAIEPPGEARSDFDIFVDFAKRMDFRDKDGKPLMSWTKPEEAFNAWRKMSKGRPCDYSAMTYDKLTGGSGIQWPCTEANPNGTERLFTDGIFYTDIEYCESYGHDLETGAPYTKDQYAAMNPAGKAFLKAAHYLPDPEEPNEEFPLRLSTGRQVYQFHTRTKTGRSKQLQEASPHPFVQVSEEDAKKLDLKEGEDVIVKSRRGQVQLPVMIGRISPGQIFIPFHYGYFDAPDGRARAANELTQDHWDPISKQPKFKSGAVAISKLPTPSSTSPTTLQPSKDEVVIHAHEKHSAAIHKVSTTKPSAHAITNTKNRNERHLDDYLGATSSAIEELSSILGSLAERFSSDPEFYTGMKLLARLNETVKTAILPMVRKYGGQKPSSGGNTSAVLRNALFSSSTSSSSSNHASQPPTSYTALLTLQRLLTYLNHVQGYFIVLTPTSQAIWDEEFVKAVGVCQGEVQRMMAWTKQQVKVRSSQTLVVPTRRREEDGGGKEIA